MHETVAGISHDNDNDMCLSLSSKYCHMLLCINTAVKENNYVIIIIYDFDIISTIIKQEERNNFFSKADHKIVMLNNCLET